MKKILKKLRPVLSNTITYIVMLILGLVTMIFPEFGFDSPAMYASIIFFALTFVSFGGYFYFRKNKESYEMLFFALICVLTGSYLFVFEYASLSYALGTGFLAFTIFNTINRIVHIDKLKKEENSLWTMRSIILILILFLSVLTIQNFYREISLVQTIMIGYYLLTFAILSLSETLLLMLMKPEIFERIMNGEFGTSKEKKLKKFNENVDELDTIVKKIDAPKKKKKNVKKNSKKITKK